MTSKTQIDEWLKNCSHYDADYREMSAKNLGKVIIAGGIDIQYEEKICLALITQLSDKHNEVKSGSV